eukprot:7382149-Prymnesium_polylepis.2
MSFRCDHAGGCGGCGEPPWSKRRAADLRRSGTPKPVSIVQRKVKGNQKRTHAKRPSALRAQAHCCERAVDAPGTNQPRGSRHDKGADDC